MVDYNVAVNGDLFPLQPGLEAACTSYVERVVEWNPITQNAAIFYQLQTKENVTGHKTWIVPDGCMDFLFSCSSSKPSTVIYGKKHTSSFITLESDTTYFGFRPMSEHGLRINEFSMSEIADSAVPFLDVFRDDYIIEAISNANSFDQRIREFKEYIKNKLNDQDYKINLAHYCFSQICANKGTIRIEELARRTGYTVRYIRRKFEESFGIPPKKFGQIVMFQNSLNMLLKKERSELDIVFENGYYDQAHMIHHFKKLVNVSPKEVRSMMYSSCR